MPKVVSQRTFTACWTCRRRNIRCDNATPHCLQCERAGLSCEGYDIRLVWVDAKTGGYVPEQRRSYRCELTWHGFAILASRDLDHLIDVDGYINCPCDLHRACGALFTAFPREVGVNSISTEHATELPTESALERDENGDCNNPIGRRGSDMTVSGAAFDAHLDAVPSPHQAHSDVVDSVDAQFLLSLWPQALYESIEPFGDPSPPNTEITDRSALRPALAVVLPHNSHEERFLFSHYLSNVTGYMIPIDDVRNPWKSIYPSIAIESNTSHSGRSLYHAMLAQAAFHIYRAKGEECGALDHARALRHYGIALCELRESLESSTEDYSSVLAALLTVNIAENMSPWKHQTWRHHFRGAICYVSRHLDRSPWLLSHKAWTITQSFALELILAQTTADHNTPTPTCNLSHVNDVLSAATSEPQFGFTVGANARLIRTIHKALTLEKQVSSMFHMQETQSTGVNGRVEAEGMIRQLQATRDHDVDLYVKHQERSDSKTLPKSRTLVKLHLSLFNVGVIVYLSREVLQWPPSAVTDHVHEVLKNAIVFLSMSGSEPCIWPIFFSALEACTPENQALAVHYFDESRRHGTGLREDVRHVVCEFWAERERLSETLRCSPAETVLDWRATARRLGIDVLLL